MSEIARAPIPDSLLASTAAFLKRYPPFDRMEHDALGFLASRLSISYHAAGSSILCADHGQPAVLYIVRSGRVQLTPSHVGLEHGNATTLSTGECFSVGALLEKRATGSDYTAALDTFCYQLPAGDFAALLDRSPHLRQFSTDYLASLLRESRRQVRAARAHAADEEQMMNRPLRAVIQRAPVSCPPDRSIAEVLRTMHEARIGSMVVVGAHDAPVGIFTRRDVLDRVALRQTPLEQSIESVMSREPRCLPAHASAYQAALLIAQHGIRHVPVVDDGRLVGVVSERDLFTLQRLSARNINRTIAQAASLPDLQHAAGDIRRLVQDMVEQGVAAEPLMLIISTLNDVLTRRVIELERPRHELEGVEWAWLVFGSEGRHEQTLSTDQDNGLVFSAPRDASLEPVRARLVHLAQAVNRALDACGYPLCKGNIMAGNARWCLTSSEWRRQFETWVADTDPEALLRAAIFFDLRALFGTEALAASLSEHMLDLTSRNPRFLRQMAQQALATRPPLGLLADFVTKEEANVKGTIDLKKSGARLFVDAARVLALASGVPHTATVQRLRHAGTKLNMSAQEVSAANEAFLFIQMLRLRLPVDGKTHAGNNHIQPDTLNEVDRRMLKESFRQARKLQSRLALDYQL